MPSASANPLDAELQIGISVTPAHVQRNTQIRYTVTITNSRAESARAIEVTLAHRFFPVSKQGQPYYPQALTFTASKGLLCTRTGVAPAGYTCSVADIEPDETLTLTSVESVRAPPSGCTSALGSCVLQFEVTASSPAGTSSQQVITPIESGGASPAPSLPPGSVLPGRRGTKIALGVLGNPSRFQNLTGQRSPIRHLIVGWNQGLSAGNGFAEFIATMGPLPLLGINSGSAISPLQIARGGGDTYLIALNRAISAWRRPLYVRPLPEMNGHWNAYCAYNHNGTRRGPERSTAAFRKAFARIYLIVHGGPLVNLQLGRLGLPPVRAILASNPFARVVWNPQGYGSPDLPGNRAAAYFPGNAYVDVVGDDLYDIRGKAEWPAARALYRAHPGKPFAFPEWGLWDLDDPGYVRAMATFVRRHPRVELLAYFSSRPGSIWDLASKPRSRAAYRRVIVPLGRLN